MSQTLRILLIDDDPDDRILITGELRQAFSGLEVQEIAQAKDLGQALETGDFDLVITDYFLGWTDGLKILRAVKDRWPDCPVIMFTGTGNEEVAVEAMKAGLEDYILKSPQHLSRLPAAVRLILERVRERRALQEAQDRYLSLFDGVPAGLYRSTPQGQFIIVNLALVQMLGYPDQESLLATNTADIYVFPETRSRWQALMEKEGMVLDFKVQARRYDGTIIWLQDNARVVRDDAGHVLYYEGSLQDITTQTQVEEALARRAQEMAALYETSLEINAQLDLSILLRAIVQRAAGLVGTRIGTLYLMEPDGETLKLVVSHNLPGDRVGTALRLGEGLPGRVAQTGEPMMVADYQHWGGRAVVYADLPVHRMLGVSLKQGDTVIGVINVTDDEKTGAFTEDEIRLVSLFAAQAVVAIANARLFEAEACRRHEAETLHAATQALSTTLDLQQVFELILTELQKVVPYDSATVQELKSNRMEIIGGRGLPNLDELMGESFDLTRDDNPNQEVARQRTPFILDDAPAVYNGFRCELHAQVGTRSWLGVPLLFGDRLTGMLSLDKHETGFYTPEHARLALAFAAQAAIAVENARLYDAAQQEIAERKQVEADLRESEERFRSMAENIQDGLTIIEHGKAVYVNDRACEIFGYSRNELKGMSGFDLAAPEEKERLHRIMEEACRTNMLPQELEFWIVRKNGLRRCVHNRYSASRLGDKIVRRYVVTSDITEHKHLEEQLLQSQKMEAIGRLAGGVAHDFNNLLTAIQGYTALLLSDLEADNPMRPDLEEIEKAAERATSLTSQLLAFSRRQVMQPTVMDLNAVVTRMEKMLQRLIGEHIDLTTVLAPALGYVEADAGQIEQVIMNLVINARDAMPGGGKLTIETANVELDENYTRQHIGTESGLYVMLAVSDTGMGIDEETKAHLFEPFFTTKEQGKGTGLGLATVHGIIKQSGGDIWVYSEPGQGTTFKIYLPRITGTIEPVEVSASAVESLQGTETILLVEDEAVVRSLAHRALSRHGYKVFAAHDASEALLICEQHKGPIHLMVTDVVMPGGVSGRELAERLASLRTETKVLYMSGYTADSIVHHGVLDPEIAFLQKPFAPDALVRKVRETLDAP